MERVASAAAQDMPSAEPGQRLRSRAASSHDRQAIGTHLWPTFLCEEKGGSLAGRREKRFTNLAIAEKREAASGSPAKRLTGLASANRNEAGKWHSGASQQEQGKITRAPGNTSECEIRVQPTPGRSRRGEGRCPGRTSHRGRCAGPVCHPDRSREWRVYAYGRESAG